MLRVEETSLHRGAANSMRADGPAREFRFRNSGQVRARYELKGPMHLLPRRGV
jgi:hypothetical protein